MGLQQHISEQDTVQRSFPVREVGSSESKRVAPQFADDDMICSGMKVSGVLREPIGCNESD